MPTFILSLNWTDQGIRSVKDAPKRAEASKELARKVGVEIKEVYLTSGDNDLVIIVDAPNGDNVAKFALALGALGNVRTRTARAWPQSLATLSAGIRAALQRGEIGMRKLQYSSG